ncbi:hypothetical protein Tco_0650710 [Tanacetum coccineum]
MTSYRHRSQVPSRSWSFASAVPGQMTHLVASLTLNSANSCVMQGASCTQRKVSMVLFVLPSILLVVVITITVVIVVVISVVVVVAIVGVVVVVVGSSVPSINKLSFVIVGSFSCYLSSARPGVLKTFDDESEYNHGGYPEMNVLTSIRKGISRINIGDSDNTGDGGKTAGRAIIAWGDGIASYACITFIYGSLIASEVKRYLVKLSEESGVPLRLGNSPVKPRYS